MFEHGLSTVQIAFEHGLSTEATVSESWLPCVMGAEKNDGEVPSSAHTKSAHPKRVCAFS